MLSKKLKNAIFAHEKGYVVTEDGNVVSPFSGSYRKLILKDHCRNYKRYVITVCDGSIVYVVDVHQLAAYQKYGKKLLNPDLQVRHLDGDSLNNSLCNICLGTKQENEMDKPKEVRKRVAINAASHNRKFYNEEVEEIRNFHNGSYKETMETFGITSKGTLHHILNNNYVTEKAI